MQLFIRFLLEVAITIVFSQMTRRMLKKLEVEELQERTLLVKSVLPADDEESFDVNRRS